MTVFDSEAILIDVVILIQKKNFIDAIRSGFVLIFSAMLCSALIQQFLDRKIEKIIQSPSGLNSMIWFWGFLSLLAALLFPLVLSLLCSFYLSREFNFEKKIFYFLEDKFELSLIETLRSWGKSFLWFFIFIIPGLVKYSFYMLSLFVVLFSKMYSKGETDALELSEKIFKKHWLYFSILTAVFYFFVPALMSTLLDEYRSFEIHPYTATVSIIFESFLLLVFHYLILKKIFNYLNYTKDLLYASDV